MSASSPCGYGHSGTPRTPTAPRGTPNQCQRLKGSRHGSAGSDLPREQKTKKRVGTAVQQLAGQGCTDRLGAALHTQITAQLYQPGRSSPSGTSADTGPVPKDAPAPRTRGPRGKSAESESETRTVAARSQVHHHSSQPGVDASLKPASLRRARRPPGNKSPGVNQPRRCKQFRPTQARPVQHRTQWHTAYKKESPKHRAHPTECSSHSSTALCSSHCSESKISCAQPTVRQSTASVLVPLPADHQI